MIKENNKKGLTTNQIKDNLMDKYHKLFVYHEIRYLLEGMQSDCIIHELFDDEVTMDDRWYLYDKL